LNASRLVFAVAARQPGEEQSEDEKQQKRHDRRVGNPGFLPVREKERRELRRNLVDRRVAEQPGQKAGYWAVQNRMMLAQDCATSFPRARESRPEPRPRARRHPRSDQIPSTAKERLPEAQSSPA